jgi:hypothetical protein
MKNRLLIVAGIAVVIIGAVFALPRIRLAVTAQGSARSYGRAMPTAV